MNHKYGEPGCTSLVQTKNNKSHPLLKTSALLIIAVLRTPRVYRLPEWFKWDGAETRSTGEGENNITVQPLYSALFIYWYLMDHTALCLPLWEPAGWIQDSRCMIIRAVATKLGWSWRRKKEFYFQSDPEFSSHMRPVSNPSTTWFCRTEKHPSQSQPSFSFGAGFKRWPNWGAPKGRWFQQSRSLSSTRAPTSSGWWIMAGQKAVTHRRTDFTARHLCRFVCCRSLLSSDWLQVCPIVCTGSLCFRSVGAARWYETPMRRLHAVPGYWMSALLPIMSHAGCQLERGVEWRPKQLVFL